jgi:hypothetical protein
MNMLTLEEMNVLRYLQGHLNATLAELARACLPGSSAGWVERVASNLDWLGYVVLYSGPDGTPAALQITDQGRGAISGGPHFFPARRRLPS